MNPDDGAAPQMCYEPTVDFFVLSVVLTEECNLRCSYCYQEGTKRHKGAMSPAVAKQAISDILTANNQFKYVVVEFIGGEVTLHWDLMVEIIEWTYTERNRWSKTFSFFIDTNGTLLDDAKKQWLSERKFFVKAGISVDGTPRAHNINRCGSYEDIESHLKFFAEMYPDQTVKMTISPKTISYIYEGILNIMSHGLEPAANVPLEDIWGPPEQKARHVEEFRAQIEKLVEFFGSNPTVPIPNIINLPIQVIFAEEKDRPWCGSGRSMTAVDVDGTILPCNRYCKMSFDHDIVKKPIQAVQPACGTCLFKPACQTCEVHNWEVNGNPNARTRFHCEFTKLQVWGTAQVRAKRLNFMIGRLQEEIDAVPTKTQIEQLHFAKIQLESIAIILAQFEEGRPLREVGAGKRTGAPYVPPLQPLWTEPQMFGAVKGSVAEVRQHAAALKKIPSKQDFTPSPTSN